MINAKTVSKALAGVKPIHMVKDSETSAGIVGVVIYFEANMLSLDSLRDELELITPGRVKISQIAPGIVFVHDK